MSGTPELFSCVCNPTKHFPSRQSNLADGQMTIIPETEDEFRSCQRLVGEAYRIKPAHGSESMGRPLNVVVYISRPAHRRLGY